MGLWHQKLIGILPNKQLCGQHRECCALRGNGWGKKHSTVDYVFEHEVEKLVVYHWQIMNEMEERGYSVESKWFNPAYAGLSHPPRLVNTQMIINESMSGRIIYPEHNYDYYKDCVNILDNKLKAKVEHYCTHYGLEDPRTIRASEDLDKIISEGMRIINDPLYKLKII